MKERQVMKEKQLTAKEAAMRMGAGVTDKTVIRMVKNRQLSGINKSSGEKHARWFVYESSLNKFLSRRQSLSLQ